MSLVRNDEKLAGRLLATVAAGVSPSVNLPAVPTAGMTADQKFQNRRPVELSAASSAVGREALLFHPLLLTRSSTTFETLVIVFIERSMTRQPLSICLQIYLSN
jgi:hypothetical protein